MDDKQFGDIIQKAVNELPNEFKNRLENVAIVISDLPTRKQLEVYTGRERGGLLLGLYEGIPQTKRGNYGVGPTLPDKITIFKIPVLQISKNYQEAIENIKSTVIHEIAHHFGMTDEDIDAARAKKG
jgi:predicted Zn-dependent protease with MMP-like domain